MKCEKVSVNRNLKRIWCSIFLKMVDGYNLNKVSWFLGVWILTICVIAIVKTLKMLISIVNKLVLTRIWNMTWCCVLSIRWKMVVIWVMQTSFWKWKCVITIVKVEDGVFKHIHCVELHPFVWSFEGFLVFQFANFVIYFDSWFTYDFVQLLML